MYYSRRKIFLLCQKLCWMSRVYFTLFAWIQCRALSQLLLFHRSSVLASASAQWSKENFQPFQHLASSQIHFKMYRQTLLSFHGALRSQIFSNNLSSVLHKPQSTSQFITHSLPFRTNSHSGDYGRRKSGFNGSASSSARFGFSLHTKIIYFNRLIPFQ